MPGACLLGGGGLGCNGALAGCALQRRLHRALLRQHRLQLCAQLRILALQACVVLHLPPCVHTGQSQCVATRGSQLLLEVVM